MGTFFTSDLHLNHANIIKYCNRPFLSESDKEALRNNGGTWKNEDGCLKWRISREAVEMMNVAIIGAINDYVTVNDTLWILGDFAFSGGENYRKVCSKMRDQIKCRTVNLVFGNHDKRSVIKDLFNETYDLRHEEIDGVSLVMCHYCLLTWDRAHHGVIQAYGHSHSTLTPWLDEHLPGKKMLDVGIDNAFKVLGEYRPFSLQEVVQYCEQRATMQQPAVDHR